MSIRSVSAERSLIALDAHPVFRVNRYRDPLWALPNYEAGRFHVAGTVPTQYLSMHPLDPYAQLIRVSERVAQRPLTAADPEVRETTYNHWTLLLTVDEVLDLDFATAARLGLDPRDLVADDHRVCRQFAADREARGLPEIWRYPSAALPGTDNLVIFGARGLTRYLASAWSPSDVPGSLSAADARPPDELLTCMRHVGDAHLGVEAFERGATVTFDQPLSFARQL